jgi:preprotein translocase subunit YajC
VLPRRLTFSPRERPVSAALRLTLVEPTGKAIMNVRQFPLLLLFGALSMGAVAQAPTPAQDSGQGSPGRQGSGQGSPGRQGSGQRGGRGAWAGGGMMGRGVMGTVTEITPEHFTVKTESGDVYIVHYSVNTRIMKGGGSGGGGRRGQADNQPPDTPPQAIKPTDIKVGDAIGASGEIDANAKSLGAVVIFQIDPERAKQMREMQANYGKTWLMGKVTAIDDANVSIQGGPDNAAHTFIADENTTFRKRRDPITLADIQVGDTVRVEGAVKNGAFVATTVGDMGVPQPRNEGAAPPPQ